MMVYLKEIKNEVRSKKDNHNLGHVQTTAADIDNLLSHRIPKKKPTVL